MKKIIFNHVVRILIIVLVSTGYSSSVSGQDGSWVAPSSADNSTNPYSGDENALKAGKKLYNQYCSICHGAKGKGDGMAGMALSPRPSNFTKEIVKSQSDGALFWKITEGKAPMASYKTVLTEEQRWQLVNYIKSL